MMSFKGLLLLILAFCKEGLDKATALCWTGFIVGTVIWGFMPVGFWDNILKHVYIGSALGFIWVLSPIIFHTIKYAYLDWRLHK